MSGGWDRAVLTLLVTQRNFKAEYRILLLECKYRVPNASGVSQPSAARTRAIKPWLLKESSRGGCLSLCSMRSVISSAEKRTYCSRSRWNVNVPREAPLKGPPSNLLPRVPLTPTVDSYVLPLPLRPNPSTSTVARVLITTYVPIHPTMRPSP